MSAAAAMRRLGALLFVVPFLAGSVQGDEAAGQARYAILLKLRIETQAAEAVPIGSKKYVEPKTIVLEAAARLTVLQTLRWSAADHQQEREVLVAEVKTEPIHSSSDSPQARLLRSELEATVAAWKKTEGQSFRQSLPRGSRVWPPAVRLALGEEAPQYLTAWLDEALQAVPLATERAWSRQRAGLENLERKSSAEELRRESVRGEPAVVWAATLSLSGRKPAAEIPPALREQGVEVVVSFHAEEQDAISLEDGRLLHSTRSASRETRWVVPDKHGSAPPFRARLACALTMEELN